MVKTYLVGKSDAVFYLTKNLFEIILSISFRSLFVPVYFKSAVKFGNKKIAWCEEKNGSPVVANLVNF